MTRDRLIGLVLRLLGAQCGAFGGQYDLADGTARWCDKRFGHSDSHAYEFGQQPLHAVRRRAQGWKS